MCQALTCGWVQARAWLQVLQKSGGHCRESSKIKASVSVHWLAHKTAKPEWLHRVSVSAGNWTHLTWLPFTGQDTCCDMQEDWCSFNTQYSCWFHFCLSFPATKVFLCWFYEMELRNSTVTCPSTKACLAMLSCSKMDASNSSALTFLRSHLPNTSHGKRSRSDFLWILSFADVWFGQRWFSLFLRHLHHFKL